ncbi:hypothetical protein [uncultured Bacteroides sp.]|uniref:hypothetical protein n=1 Tax=uncultured Bacteroides sp. TaxID=162156 RepID=UPI002AABDCE4|nr:hypothetical protein [uncultured Bacteroides sp.]
MEETSKLKPMEIDNKKFKEDCKAFINNKLYIDANQRSYYISYLEFLKHFKDITNFKKHDVIVGIKNK